MAACNEYSLVVLGSSQVKYLTSERLQLPRGWMCCTFSYPGATTAQIECEMVGLLAGKPKVDHLALYAGGNTLERVRYLEEDPLSLVVDGLMDLLKKAQTFAHNVHIFGLAPRSMRKDCLLQWHMNRKLQRALGVVNWPCVSYVDLECLMWRRKRAKPGVLACDGLHVHGGLGIDLMSVALRKSLFAVEHVPFVNFVGERRPRFRCRRCFAEGHLWHDQCEEFFREVGAMCARRMYQDY